MSIQTPYFFFSWKVESERWEVELGMEMGEYDAGTPGPDDFSQRCFTGFRDFFYRAKMLQQQLRSLFTDSVDFLQCIAECPAASFFPVEGNPKAMDFVPDLPDQHQR